MNANLLAIVKQIVTEQGDSILSEPRCVSAFFADLAQDISKPQKNAFVKCLEYDSAQVLKNVSEPERETCIQQFTQKLHEEEGLDLALCGETLELLAEALFGDEQKKVYCRNCGKELQEEWEVCPYCSTLTATDTVSADKAASETSDKEAELTKPDTAAQTNETTSENFQLEEKLKKTKSRLTAAIVLGILGILISIIVGVSLYNEMVWSYNEMVWSYNDMVSSYNQEKSKYEKLSAEYEKLKSLRIIEVTSIKMGNWKDGWLSRPGDRLSADKMRYFRPVITYNSAFTGGATLYVRIIQPNGQLYRNATTSPTGFSYSTTSEIYSGSNHSLDLDGWGNSDRSNYWAGNWTVEVWYKDLCLKSEKVVIGQ